MGGIQSSSNEVDSWIDAQVSIIAETLQKQSSSQIASNDINIRCRDINIYSITQEVFISLDAKSIQKAIHKSASDQDVKDSIKQLTEQVEQNMSFNFTDQESHQIMKIATHLSQMIHDSIQQISTPGAAASNSLNIVCGTANIAYVKQSDTVQMMIETVQETKQVIDAKQKLVQVLDQTTQQTVKNALGALAMILVAIAVVIMAPMIGTGMMLKHSPAMQLMTVLIAWALIMWYLYAECVSHFFPIFTIPFIEMGIFPHWCKTNMTKYISMSLTTLAFGTMALFLVKSLKQGVH